MKNLNIADFPCFSLEKPPQVTLKKGDCKLHETDKFFERSEVFDYKMDVNFKTSQAIGFINYNGNEWVSNLKRIYNTLTNKDSPLVVNNLELLIDASLVQWLKHIAKKQVDHAALRNFLFIIADEHQFVELEDYKITQKYFIDSRKIDESIELMKEYVKLDQWIHVLKKGELPSTPRLKKLKLPELVEIDVGRLSYSFLKSVLDLNESDLEKYLEPIQFNSDSENGVNLIKDAFKTINFKKVELLESKGFIFQKNDVYRQVKDQGVFNQLGD